MNRWHELSPDEVMKLLETSISGLSSSEINQRTADFGPNQLTEQKRQPALLRFLSQFGDFMILVLIAAAVISAFAGGITDSIIIVVIVMVNALVGFLQEYRAEKAVAALTQLATPATSVIREGQIQQISSVALVPGDIVLLEAGNVVPADLRLLEVHSLRMMESSLTGESTPVEKSLIQLSATEQPLAERFNLAFKGTQVVYGRGKGVVVATGMQTELGHIAQLLQQADVSTPLQLRMADFGKKLSWLVIAVCVMLFVIGLWRGEKPLDMLLVAISLAVAAIPEALPALITISLARGAGRLVRKSALIRKLPAVETLGSVNFICSDKTGTLTQNKMIVTAVNAIDYQQRLHPSLSLLECAMALNHDVLQTETGKWSGDPTEIALVDYITKHHSSAVLQELSRYLPRVAELPFDSHRKCMTTVHRFKAGYLIISKGAVESITNSLLDLRDKEFILGQASMLADKGARVLAFAYKMLDNLPANLKSSEIEAGLSFVGLVGMIDPPREEVKSAIRECRSAGIIPVMITGDHLQTATAIARQIGMLKEGDLTISGSELAAMTAEKLDEKIENIRVYARVSPEQKLMIVRCLQSKNHFVAMTGDGINDAPSLKAANIGIAMGITGTDVSKEAADMILLDDNFATIVKAVREGRRIYDNIRRFVKYIMTCNSAEIWTLFLAPLLGLPIPLMPIHILWINLVTDGLPGLTLSSENAERNIMKRPPRRSGESLFSEGIGIHILWVGLFMAALTLGTQAVAIAEGNQRWQTMVFTVLAFAQLGHVFAIRSDHEFVYRKGLLVNPALLAAIIGTFFLQLLVIYLPWANRVFKTQALALTELLLCIGLAVLLFHVVEFEKWIKQRRTKSRTT